MSKNILVIDKEDYADHKFTNLQQSEVSITMAYSLPEGIVRAMFFLFDLAIVVQSVANPDENNFPQTLQTYAPQTVVRVVTDQMSAEEIHQIVLA